MRSDGLDPLGCALFLVAAFVLSGGAQALWLGSAISRRCAWPLDGGRTFRRQRLLGDNKTLRGLVVMVPATGTAFLLLSLVASNRLPGLWALTPVEYAALGMLAGASCMAGELPNSFIKRQLGIPPGCAATGTVMRPVFFVLDRLDSTLGVLVALSIAVPLPPATVAYVLLLGVTLHGALSVMTFRLGGKARLA